MEAFLLAAGLGTRLRPLTEIKPKPLVDLSGKPIIAWNLERIARAGVKKVVVNAHYKSEMIEAYLGDGNAWGLDILISKEQELLDTGGGLKRAWGNFSSSHVLCWNSDVFIDPVFCESRGSVSSEFKALEQVSHDPEKSPLVTILVREDTEDLVNAYGSIGISSDGRVVEFLGTRYVNQDVFKRVMFAGISILSKRVERYLEINNSVFSLTKNLFPQILHDSAHSVSGGIWSSFCSCYWNDIGTIDRLNEASKHIDAILPLQRNTEIG
jgi:NDP-sugar pyrophosphorylase family protein